MGLHVERFKHKIVRDLAWVIHSQPLISDGLEDLPALSLSDLLDASSTLQWLEKLDSDPSELLDFLVRKHIRRLGFLYQSLLEFVFVRCPSLGCEAVLCQQQIEDSEERGRVIGQIKHVMCLNRGQGKQAWHVESAIKFYVDSRLLDEAADERTGLASFSAEENERRSLLHFVGPFLHESLAWRLVEMNRKLELCRASSAIQEDLKGRLGASEVSSVTFIKGYLFYRLYKHTDSCGGPSLCNPHHNRGWWCLDTAELAHWADGPFQWAILPKMHWMSPVVAISAPDPHRVYVEGVAALRIPELTCMDFGALMAELSRLRTDAPSTPHLVAQLREREGGIWVEESRGFLLPSDWDPSTLCNSLQPMGLRNKHEKPDNWSYRSLPQPEGPEGPSLMPQGSSASHPSPMSIGRLFNCPSESQKRTPVLRDAAEDESEGEYPLSESPRPGSMPLHDLLVTAAGLVAVLRDRLSSSNKHWAVMNVFNELKNATIHLFHRLASAPSSVVGGLATTPTLMVLDGLAIIGGISDDPLVGGVPHHPMASDGEALVRPIGHLLLDALARALRHSRTPSPKVSGAGAAAEDNNRRRGDGREPAMTSEERERAVAVLGQLLSMIVRGEGPPAGRMCVKLVIKACRLFGLQPASHNVPTPSSHHAVGTLTDMASFVDRYLDQTEVLIQPQLKAKERRAGAVQRTITEMTSESDVVVFGDDRSDGDARERRHSNTSASQLGVQAASGGRVASGHLPVRDALEVLSFFSCRLDDSRAERAVPLFVAHAINHYAELVDATSSSLQHSISPHGHRADDVRLYLTAAPADDPAHDVSKGAQTISMPLVDRLVADSWRKNHIKVARRIAARYGASLDSMGPPPPHTGRVKRKNQTSVRGLCEGLPGCVIDAERQMVWLDTREGLRQLWATLQEMTASFGESPAPVGLDCEWHPRNRLGERRSPVSLMQVALPCSRVFLVDVLTLRTTERAMLGEVIEWLMRKCVVVGFSVSGDLDRLAQSLDGVFVKEVPRVVDLQRIFSSPHAPLLSQPSAPISDPSPPTWFAHLSKSLQQPFFGLDTMCALYLHQRLDKAYQRSSWEDRPLTDAQKAYAALDAIVLLKIAARVFPLRDGFLRDDSVALDEQLQRVDITRFWFAYRARAAHVQPTGSGSSETGRGYVSDEAYDDDTCEQSESDAKTAESIARLLPYDVSSFAYSPDHLHGLRTPADVRRALDDLGLAATPLLKIDRVFDGPSGDGVASVVPAASYTMVKTVAFVAEADGSGDGDEERRVVGACVCVLPLHRRADKAALGCLEVWRDRVADGSGDHGAPLSVRLASEGELYTVCGYPRGALGPLALCDPTAFVVVDASLMSDDVDLLLGGGARDVVYPMKAATLVRVTGTAVTAVAVDE
ncbi:unnamed protein product [Vitrella brassicaformis CCMP3155]|uniref:3'-5' exonuclease domain-containing protein n=1 Tax=Vitrella brassicaformis (strain CCMP3155) TaxID=1169540 RepID=A0A0G4F965_VITBC|nr:unnamed protein product [Vitrella brassicaformis CCMP3155]|eukprot:CEM08905.1 unnamed protein product [Vitrella brassicaformis CCMP3155]